MNSVAALAPDDVWAVGRTAEGHRLSATLTLHWDGTAWHRVPSPDGGQDEAYLDAISAAGPNDIWAVGYVNMPSGEGQPLCLHWDGSGEWVNTRCVGEGHWSALEAVTALPDGSAIAGGELQSDEQSHTFIEAYADGAWTRTSAPDVGAIRGVSAAASTDVWALGANQGTKKSPLLHNGGASWSRSPARNVTGMNSISLDSSSDGWLAGTGGVVHWDGARWRPHDIEGDPQLLAVSALAPDDAWAVGETSDWPPQPCIEHWDGAEWTQTLP